MRRICIEPRGNLADRARETGFELLSVDGSIYWDESAYYGFSLRQIEGHIEDPTKELASLCLALVDRAVGNERTLERLRIPAHAWDLIAESWRRGDRTAASISPMTETGRRSFSNTMPTRPRRSSKHPCSNGCGSKMGSPAT
jgi:glutathionylspermidine synthase